MPTTYLLLGSNKGDRFYNLQQTVQCIRQIGTITKQSHIYETQSWGFQADILFLNQALELSTTLPPKQLLGALLQIEKQLGRTRNPNATTYASRTIDIDMLLYGNSIINTPILTIPHARLHLRNFALTPLCEIAAHIKHPILLCTMQELLCKCVDMLTVTKLSLVED